MLIFHSKPSRISEIREGPNLSYFHTDPPQADLMPYGAVMALAINVTAVCANALPFITAPVFSTIAV